MIQMIMKMDSNMGFVSDIHNFKLKNLTFSKYNDENEDEDEITNILNFDMSKVSVESNEKGDFKILYDNKLLKINIISFCSLVKRDKDQKEISTSKLRIDLQVLKFGKYFTLYLKKFMKKLNSFKFTADSMKVTLERDEELPLNTLNYSEDYSNYFV